MESPWAHLPHMQPLPHLQCAYPLEVSSVTLFVVCLPKRRAGFKFLIIPPFSVSSSVLFCCFSPSLPSPHPSFHLSFSSCFNYYPGVEIRRPLSSEGWFVILTDPKRRGTHCAMQPQGTAPEVLRRQGETGAFIVVSTARSKEGG